MQYTKVKGRRLQGNYKTKSNIKKNTSTENKKYIWCIESELWLPYCSDEQINSDWDQKYDCLACHGLFKISVLEMILYHIVYLQIYKIKTKYIKKK